MALNLRTKTRENTEMKQKRDVSSQNRAQRTKRSANWARGEEKEDGMSSSEANHGAIVTAPEKGEQRLGGVEVDGCSGRLVQK